MPVLAPPLVGSRGWSGFLSPILLATLRRSEARLSHHPNVLF